MQIAKIKIIFYTTRLNNLAYYRSKNNVANPGASQV